MVSRAGSGATPKGADYPFTTRYPNLGVVSGVPGRSFVSADIPGLIEGAADGAGLGSLFLRHVQRTRLLLHLVDIAPMETGVEAEPVEQVRAIEAELRKYDPRSEEHTSELQSLMRISYAVFCLQKQTTTIQQNICNKVHDKT